MKPSTLVLGILLGLLIAAVIENPSDKKVIKPEPKKVPAIAYRHDTALKFVSNQPWVVVSAGPGCYGLSSKTSLNFPHGPNAEAMDGFGQQSMQFWIRRLPKPAYYAVEYYVYGAFPKTYATVRVTYTDRKYIEKRDYQVWLDGGAIGTFLLDVTPSAAKDKKLSGH